MVMLKMKIGVVLSVVAILVMGIACGPGGEPTPQPGPSGNQPPVISSLTPERTQVLPSTVQSPSIIVIECVASDPNGDILSHEWATTGGKFSGSGATISWVAPEHLGDYKVTVTVEDGKGASAVQSITISVVSNQAPEVLDLTADPTAVSPKERSTITCVARDMDGDAVTYRWRASGGSVTGEGDVVTWIAPDVGGDYTVTVTVSDSKGGQNTGQVTIVVGKDTHTQSFNPVATETGTVDSKGDKDTTFLKAGDSDKDLGYHAFFSFDITALKDADVKEAQLVFTTANVVGKPFDRGQQGIGGLKMYRVRGERGKLPDYDEKGELLTNAIATTYEPPTVVDVTPEVTSALLAPGINTYVQFEAKFVLKTNGNHVPDYIDWKLVTLKVTYDE